MSHNGPNRRPLARPAAYLAAAWSFAFAAISFYWAAGGSVGLKTIARDTEAVGWAGDPAVVALTGVLKIAAGLLALALSRPRGEGLPRRLLLAGGFGTGALLTLYGAASLVDHVLMLTGVRDTPELLGERAAWWHALLWDPVWILGGLLFLAAAREARNLRPRPT